jgi:hypothetical protein
MATASKERSSHPKGAPRTAQGSQEAATTTLVNYLGGLNFPAKKDVVLKQAKHNGADKATLGTIQNIPAKNFVSLDVLVKQFGQAAQSQ